MRMPVRALVGVHVLGADAEVVVLVVNVGWRQSAEETEQVLQQQRFGLLDTNGHRGVSGDDGDNPVLYAGAAHGPSDVIRDVHELDRLGRREGQPAHIDGGLGSVAAKQLHLGRSIGRLVGFLEPGEFRRHVRTSGASARSPASRRVRPPVADG